MLDGNVNEFVGEIYYGSELVFTFNNEKFFLQGLYQDGKYTLYLARWEPPMNDYIWVSHGTDTGYPVDEFLAAKIWNGKSFWEAELEMRWVDN